MKPIHIIILSSIALLILFFAVSIFQRHKVEFHFTRTYKKGPPLIHDYKTDAVNPGIIRVYDDTIYVFDYATNAIKKYDPDGRLLSVIDLREHQQHIGLIKNVDVDASSIRLPDVRNNGVFRYDQLSHGISFDSIGLIYDAACLSAEKMLFTSFDPATRDFSLQTYNEANGKTEIIQSPFTLYGDEALANSGFFKKSNGRIIYTLYYLGKFYVIDSSLRNIDTIRTIDEYNTPPETIKEGSKTLINRKSPTVNRDAACDTNYVYIISGIRSVADKKISPGSVIVDVYDLRRRSYDHSFTLEKIYGAFDDIFIQGKILYVLTGKHILQYKL